MPGDSVGLTGGSAVNFRTSESIAKAATAKVAAHRTVKVYAWSTADVVIDVVGYFAPVPPEAHPDPVTDAATVRGSSSVAPTKGASGLSTSATPIRV